MHGPTCIFWANLTPFSLRFRFFNLDKYGKAGVLVALGLGCIVALHYHACTLYHIY